MNTRQITTALAAFARNGSIALSALAAASSTGSAAMHWAVDRGNPGMAPWGRRIGTRPVAVEPSGLDARAARATTARDQSTTRADLPGADTTFVEFRDGQRG